jgi:phosphonate transport system substrate-binding protein
MLIEDVLSIMKLTRIALTAIALTAVIGTACGSGSSPATGPTAAPGEKPTLVIGGIPDQDVSVLEERFNGIADYLEKELNITVEYRSSISYSALVTAFRNGDVKLAWFGGLTGVQARLATQGAVAIAQRPLDTEFRSVFIIRSDIEADSLAGLRGRSFTFGSESSTSGHLMPRYFLNEAGVDPETDFRGKPSYSGSHDTTWKLVEAGTFDAGALSQAVWDRAVAEGQVDTSKVKVLLVTDTYYDYHWLAGPALDPVYGAGTTDQFKAALLAMSVDNPGEKAVLDLFQTGSFIATENSDYDALESTARGLGLIE